MDEHPIEQPIISVFIGDLGEGMEEYRVGALDGRNVTRIEACVKSGPHSYIPYVRVWSGDVALAEFCQHNIVGVVFGNPADDQ